MSTPRPSGQFLDRVLEPVGQHDVGGARRPRDLALVLGADHRDDARRAEHLTPTAASTCRSPPAAPCTKTDSPSCSRPRTVSAKYMVRSLNSNPAPAVKLTLSGNLKTRSGASTATSAMPPVSMVRPTTRSPALTGASAGADRTTPAISAPSTNGGSGGTGKGPGSAMRRGRPHRRRAPRRSRRRRSVHRSRRPRLPSGPSSRVNCAARMPPPLSAERRSRLTLAPGRGVVPVVASRAEARESARRR